MAKLENDERALREAKVLEQTKCSMNGQAEGTDIQYRTGRFPSHVINLHH